MPRYTLGSPHLPDTLAEGDHFDGNWLCSHCHEPLLPGQWIRQQALYKLGELDSIPVAYAVCAPDYDNAEVEPEPADYSGGGPPIVAGDRLLWLGSGPDWHTALGPVTYDQRRGGTVEWLVRVKSPSGQHVDAVVPELGHGLVIDRSGRTCPIRRDARVPCNLCDQTCPNYQPTGVT